MREAVTSPEGGGPVPNLLPEEHVKTKDHEQEIALGHHFFSLHHMEKSTKRMRRTMCHSFISVRDKWEH